MKRLPLLILLLLLLTVLSANACFGPKLYIGVESTSAGELNFALLSLYIKEKTGVEAVRVDVPLAKGAAAVSTGDQVDLATAPAGTANGILTLPDGTILLGGERVQNDLQFTTVLPALRKLQQLLQSTDSSALLPRVKAGEGAGAVVRSWLKEHKAL